MSKYINSQTEEQRAERGVFPLEITSRFRDLTLKVKDLPESSHRIYFDFVDATGCVEHTVDPRKQDMLPKCHTCERFDIPVTIEASHTRFVEQRKISISPKELETKSVGSLITCDTGRMVCRSIASGIIGRQARVLTEHPERFTPLVNNGIDTSKSAHCRKTKNCTEGPNLFAGERVLHATMADCRLVSLKDFCKGIFCALGEKTLCDEMEKKELQILKDMEDMKKYMVDNDICMLPQEQKLYEEAAYKGLFILVSDVWMAIPSSSQMLVCNISNDPIYFYNLPSRQNHPFAMEAIPSPIIFVAEAYCYKDKKGDCKLKEEISQTEESGDHLAARKNTRDCLENLLSGIRAAGTACGGDFSLTLKKCKIVVECDNVKEIGERMGYIPPEAGEAFLQATNNEGDVVLCPAKELKEILEKSAQQGQNIWKIKRGFFSNKFFYEKEVECAVIRYKLNAPEESLAREVLNEQRFSFQICLNQNTILARKTGANIFFDKGAIQNRINILDVLDEKQKQLNERLSEISKEIYERLTIPCSRIFGAQVLHTYNDARISGIDILPMGYLFKIFCPESLDDHEKTTVGEINKLARFIEYISIFTAYRHCGNGDAVNSFAVGVMNRRLKQAEME